MSADWEGLAGALGAVEAELRAQAPDADTAAQVRPYLARLLTDSLHEGFLAYEDMASGLKRIWPRYAGAWLDYRMWRAQVTPGQTYRLTGEREDAERLGVGTYTLTPEGVSLLEDYTVLGEGPIDLVIGPDGPLRTTDGTRIIIVRELLRGADKRPARLQLRHADGSSLRLPATPCDLSQTAARVAAIARQFARWTELMAEHPNTITTPPDELAAAYIGDAGTHYYPGYFDLAENEVLVIERPAMACFTWSISALTHWLEPLAPPFAETGRTDDRRLGLSPDAAATVRLAAQGDAEIVTGRRRGALLYRTIGAPGLAIPKVWVERR